LGFEKDRYIGILINIVTVAYTGVIAVKIFRLLYGNDTDRIKRLITLFSFCGIFSMFAAIHLRDALALLTVTSLAYGWNAYLSKPNFRAVLLLVGLTTASFVFFGFVRAEFVYVPLAMLLAGVTALFIGGKGGGLGQLVSVAAAVSGLGVAMVALPNLSEQVLPTLFDQGGAYAQMSAERASSDSLGAALLGNQPLLIKIIFGSVLLYIFPVPFWSGFQFETVYHLFKSLNVIFFYFLIPLFALSLLRLSRVKSLRTPAMMFNVFVVLGFTMAVASSSGETRHLGSFLVPLFMVALLPDLNVRGTKKAYKILLGYFLFAVLFVHLTWAVLKFF